MDLNSLTQIFDNFIRTDFGRAVFQGIVAIFNTLFPANAPAASDVPLPTPNKPTN
ncbi:hypothetical protein [Corynebacterium falsenii]|uniref:hypothetical protein n=1 Tax=Corynebacterium falsenii TaxID=108486 RepID=UPI00160444C0|nr:hypothetical protein [Corynebacterium falsenii]